MPGMMCSGIMIEMKKSKYDKVRIWIQELYAQYRRQILRDTLICLGVKKPNK